MQFDSLAAALSMGGHGPYVWFVFAAALLVALALLLLPRLRGRRIAREQLGRLAREARRREDGRHAPGA